MSNVIPIHRRRLEREAVRYILHEASEDAEARLRAYDCRDDCVLQDTVDLLADNLWRLPYFAAETRYAGECLRTLRYIAGEFPMTPDTLKVLLICFDLKDDQYRDASEGAA